MPLIKCDLKDCTHNNINQGGSPYCRCHRIHINKVGIGQAVADKTSPLSFFPICKNYTKIQSQKNNKFFFKG